MRTTQLVSLALITFAVACGGTNPNATGDAANQIDAPPDGPPIPPGYQKLIGRMWSLGPNDRDVYRCVRITVTEDMYVTNFAAQAPDGTHHTVLSIASGNAAGPDGEQDCSAGTLGMVMLYASGVGTSPLDFPTDVGVKISAGQQIHLNLHLFNFTNAPLSGESAILVKAQSTPPPTLAEMVFDGTFAIFLPNNPTTPQSVVGTCTANAPSTVFAVWPHMHQIATHQKIDIIRGASHNVIHDRDYTFTEQNYYKLAPEVSVQTGDRIEVTCTYLNDTGATVTFGDGSQKEMCFGGLYRYPAANSGLFCTQ